MPIQNEETSSLQGQFCFFPVFSANSPKWNADVSLQVVRLLQVSG